MDFHFDFNKDLNVLEFRLINQIKKKEHWVSIQFPVENQN